MTRRTGVQLARQVGKIHRGEAFWRSALSRQRASGLAQREFCQREGLANSTFALWSRRLSGAHVQATPLQFVQVTPAAEREADASDTGAGLRIRLDLGCGIVLEMVRA